MSEPAAEQPQQPSSPQEYELACPECRSGMIRLRHLTYFTWLHDELITVPNFPAWVCDVCGRREYDNRAINWLNILLNPSAGKRAHSRRSRNRLTGTDHPHP